LDASVNAVKNLEAAIGAKIDAFAPEYTDAQMNFELALAIGERLAQCSDVLDMAHGCVSWLIMLDLLALTKISSSR
jgi:hypothetical protein